MSLADKSSVAAVARMLGVADDESDDIETDVDSVEGTEAPEPDAD